MLKELCGGGLMLGAFFMATSVIANKIHASLIILFIYFASFTGFFLPNDFGTVTFSINGTKRLEKIIA